MRSLTRRSAVLLATTLCVAAAACSTEPVAPSAGLRRHPAETRGAPPVTLAWHTAARQQIATNNLNALVASRLLAAMSVAQARAVAAVDADLTGRGEARVPRGAVSRARYEARRGAVAGAAVRVLAWFTPAATAALEEQLAAQGRNGDAPAHPMFTRGVAAGQAAGDAMIAQLATDGFTNAWTGTVPTGPGLWTPAALPPAGAMLGQVRPYFLTSNDQFRPEPPPAFGSPAFEADLAEVVSITTALTDAQRAIAVKWAFAANTYTPVGYWDELAGEYVAEAGLDEAAAARVFAMTNAAVFDALIACFEAKYHFWTLRPHQADPAVVRSIGVPNYPSYPSGHGSASAAGARVLAHFFPERADELNDLVAEAARSRVYGGIHYDFDMVAARAQGERVADFALTRGLP